MQDPHPPHPAYRWTTCPTPSSVQQLGTRWTCPDCGRTYYAADDNGHGGSFLWRYDPIAEQPDLPEPDDLE